MPTHDVCRQPARDEATACGACLLRTRKWKPQRRRERCTQRRLGEKLRRAAGSVQAENGRRIRFVARQGRDCHEWVQVWNRGNLRRLANCLEQELADFARVGVGDTTAGGYDLAGGRVVVDVSGRIVQVTNDTHVAIAVDVCGAGDDLQAVMVAVLRRQRVQSLAEHRNADVSRQQQAGTQFSIR